MFRLWAKIWKNNHIIKDMVVENPDLSINRTKKVFSAVEKICYEFNISGPIWLDLNKKDFIRYDRTRFYQDNFIDSIDFDYLEIQVIEED